jgi:hypothetical protein
MSKKEKGSGYFFVGHGTLGKVKNGEEIPEGYITNERMEFLKSKNKIGEKFGISKSEKKPEVGDESP